MMTEIITLLVLVVCVPAAMILLEFWAEVIALTIVDLIKWIKGGVK